MLVMMLSTDKHNTVYTSKELYIAQYRLDKLYSPWAKSGQTPVFVNKVLMEHSNAHSFMY